MNITLRGKLLGSIVLAGSSLFPFVAFAQSNGSTEEVVVTAEKRTEVVRDVPISMSVLGQTELSLLNARSFEDIADQVPGLTITESDPTHPTLILRGINAGGVGSTVATYLDETPYGSSNALANGAATAPNLDTFDMQRIEVLRGPQGTLYGASAEGGLLKFVSNAPDTNGFDDAVELGGIDLDKGGTGGSVRAMVNVALTDDLAVRVVGFEVRTPGYEDIANLHLQNVNDLTNFGGRASVLYRPTDKVTVRVNVLQQQLDSGDAPAEDVDIVGTKIYPKYGDYQEARAGLEPDGVRYYIYNTTVDWDLDWATLTSSTSYDNLRDFEVTDGTGIYGAFVQGFLHQGRIVQELRLASATGQGPLEWLAGFYYTDEHDSLHQDIVTSFHGPLLFPGSFLQLDSKYVETSGFANATYHFTPTFDINFGGRYSHNSQSSDEFGLAAAAGISSSDIFTWSTAARYHLDDQTVLYARVATGFRPGGPNDLPVGAPSAIPATYGSDSLIDYEAGVKGDLPDDRLSFDADMFLIDWQNIQLLTLIDNTGVNTNGGTASSEGAEADVTWQPVDRLTLNLNGAYTDAQLTQDTNALVVGGLKGNPLPWTPKWSLTFNGDYQFEPIGDWTPYVGGTWHYAGTRYTDFVSGLEQSATVTHNQYAMPSYNTVDLRVGVDWKAWSLEIYGKNLNDAKGFLAFSPTGTSAASGNAPSVSVMEPRLFGIVLRGKI